MTTYNDIFLDNAATKCKLSITKIYPRGTPTSKANTFKNNFFIHFIEQSILVWDKADNYTEKK